MSQPRAWSKKCFNVTHHRWQILPTKFTRAVTWWKPDLDTTICRSSLKLIARTDLCGQKAFDWLFDWLFDQSVSACEVSNFQTLLIFSPWTLKRFFGKLCQIQAALYGTLFFNLAHFFLIWHTFVLIQHIKLDQVILVGFYRQSSTHIRVGSDGPTLRILGSCGVVGLWGRLGIHPRMAPGGELARADVQKAGAGNFTRADFSVPFDGPMFNSIQFNSIQFITFNNIFFIFSFFIFIFIFLPYLPKLYPGGGEGSLFGRGLLFRQIRYFNWVYFTWDHKVLEMTADWRRHLWEKGITHVQNSWTSLLDGP